MSTAYYFSTAHAPQGAAAQLARWDPNTPGCVGISHDDGTFCFLRLPSGARQRFQLYVTSQPSAGAGAPPPPRPTPVTTPWALWAFVPGDPASLLFVFLAGYFPSDDMESRLPSPLFIVGARD